MTDMLTRGIGSALSFAFDPDPIVFKAADELGVGPVRRACKRPDGVHYILKNLLNRNAFLCGCLDFTEEEPIEHLVVGLGFKHGATTKVQAVAHSRGSESSVKIPPVTYSAIERHLKSGHHAEVLLFHNHPANPVRAILDNLPLASDADRRLWAAEFLKPERMIKTLLGGGRLRCFIGENGSVGEFRTPQLLDVLQSVIK